MWRSRGRAAWLLAACLLGCAETPPQSILLVSIDTLRRDHLGAYGSGAGLTPELDALAATSLVHDAAYTTMPTTGPAHVSLFTGLLPSEHGVLRNGRPLSADLRAQDVSAQLTGAGYATAAFVTSTLMSGEATGLVGFEHRDEPTEVLRPGRDAVAAALRWLDAEPRRPVLLFVHLYDPHAPYGSAEEKREGLPLPPGAYGWVDPRRYAGPDARRQMAARYARGVRDADAAAGALIRGVRERLARPPVVIVTADHGESLDERLLEHGYGWDHGEFLDDETVAIPLLVSGPGVTPGRSTGVVSIRDLHGTLRAIAGLAAPGEPLRDLRRPDAAPRRAVVQRRAYDALPRPEVGRHAAAATDGRHLVVVGQDGGPTRLAFGAAPELLELARRHLPGSEEPPATAIDRRTREALESLGYAQ